jgi:hypothetical protein
VLKNDKDPINFEEKNWQQSSSGRTINFLQASVNIIISELSRSVEKKNNQLTGFN